MLRYTRDSTISGIIVMPLIALRMDEDRPLGQVVVLIYYMPAGRQYQCMADLTDKWKLTSNTP
jgi:hypothetical protein